MAGHGEKMGLKEDEAVAALLTHDSITAAAAAAGVCEKTLRTWLKDEDFLRAYRAARRTVVEAALAQLQRVTGEAVMALRRNLTCGHAGSEIRAAVAVLDHACRALELTDLMQRVEGLEQRLLPKKDAK